MRAEIIAIGNEVLTGQIADTNSAFLARRLSQVGVEVARMITIEDSLEIINHEIKRALSRSDLVITTGGLGPTSDDLTRQALAKALGRPLIFEEDLWGQIEERLSQRGVAPFPENRSQAYLPQGAEGVPNPLGTAPGIHLKIEGKILFSLPGVPQEMRSMAEKFLLPQLKGKPTPHCVLRTTGISESEIYQRIKSLTGSHQVKIAFLPSPLGVDLGIEAPAKGTSQEISQVVERIEEILGEAIYGGEEEGLEEVVGRLLAQREETLAVAESCTGGLICDRLTDISGSSRYFERGVISYSNQAKLELLGVPPETIREHGAVSPQTAIAMAEGIREISDTDYGLSVTGIAGPTGGSREKPVGLCFIGFAHRGGSSYQRYLFAGPRRLNKERAAQAALNMVRLFLCLGISKNSETRG